MSNRWDDGTERVDPLAWWQAIGLLLLVSGIGPILLAQLAYWAWTGSRLPA